MSWDFTRLGTQTNSADTFGPNDALSVLPFAQSVGEYSSLSGAVEGFRDLTYTIQAHFFGIDLEIRLLIGVGLIVAIAVWARRPSGA